MRDDIAGICRFSFLGKCDRVETCRKGGDSPQVLAGRIPKLYAEARLSRRLNAFEKLCLPSIRAQTDPDFRFWIVSSPEMPKPWPWRIFPFSAGWIPDSSKENRARPDGARPAGS